MSLFVGLTIKQANTKGERESGRKANREIIKCDFNELVKNTQKPMFSSKNSALS